MPRKKSREDGYWKDFGNVETVLRDIVEKTGSFPSPQYLRGNGHYALCSAIYQHHGSLRSVQERMGFRTKLRREELTSEELVEKELRRIAEELGHFPNHKEMKGYSSVISEAAAKFGGLGYFRDRYLGLTPEKKAAKVKLDREQKIGQLREISSKLGRFPSDKALQRMRRFDLITFVRNEGGYVALRDKLGIKPEEGLSSIDYALQIAAGIMERNGFERFPGSKILVRLGHGDLVTAICNHHEGFGNFRERLYEYLGVEAPTVHKNPTGYWKDWSNFERELKLVMGEIDHFPTGKELRQLGYSTLSSAMSEYHGGIRAVRERMGINSGRDELESLLEAYASGGNTNAS